MGRTIYAIIVMFFSLVTYGQGEISGKVIDTYGTPLDFVTIRVNNSGTQTDSLGNFKLAVSEKEIHIVISRFCFITFDTLVSYSANPITITLQQDPNCQVIITDTLDRDADFIKEIPVISPTKLVPDGFNLSLAPTEQAKATTQARALFNNVPGLNIWESDYGGLQLGVGSRGLSPNRTSTFNSRQNGYDISADALGYPETYYTPPTLAVKEIEIIRGAGALQYGPQFGGMLNFVLVEPSQKNLAFETNNSYGSYNLFRTFNRISGTPKTFRYQAYYQYTRSDGWRPNSEFGQHQLGVSFGQNVTENFTYDIEYTHMNYLAHQPGGLTDAMFEEDPTQSIRERNWFKINWNLIALKSNWEINRKHNLNLNSWGLIASRDALGYLGRIDRADPGEERTLISGNFQNFGVELRHLYKYEMGEKSIGALMTGIRYYQGNSTSDQGDASDGSDADFSFTNPENLENHAYIYPSRNAAVFIQNAFLINKWSIVPGIRAEYIGTKSDGYYRNIIQHPNTGEVLLDTTIYENDSYERPVFLAGTGIGYRITEDIKVFGNISMNYRAINFSDIRVSNPNQRIDPNIQDESGFTSELGFTGKIGKYFHFNTAAFYIQYNDRIGNISMVDSTSFLVYQYRTNVSNSRSVGIELLLQYDLLKQINPKSDWGLILSVNGAYVNAIYTSAQSIYQGNQVEDVSPITVRGSVKLIWKDLSFVVMGNYTHQHYSDASNSEFSPNAITGLIPSYYTLDASAQYKFPKWFSVNIGINNFTNTSYFTRRASGYPGPGIIPSVGLNVYGGIKFQIETKR